MQAAQSRGMLEKHLQSDLHTIKTDAGKKYPKIRDAAERADRYLREVGERDPESDAQVAALLQESAEMLQPALVSIETKNSKFSCWGLGYAARLATYDAIESSCFQQLSQQMRLGAEGSADEQVQLRILQCVTAAMQAPSLLANKVVVCQLVETLLALYNSKSPIITNTAAATLRQCVCALFEYSARAVTSPARHPTESAGESEEAGDITPSEEGRQKERALSEVQKKELVAAADCLANSTVIMQELGNIAAGKPSKLAFKPHPATDMLCLEVLDAVIRSQPGFVSHHQCLLTVLHQGICPFLQDQMQKCIGAGTKREQRFSYCLRIFRLSAAVMSNLTANLLSESANLLSIMIFCCNRTDIPMWQQQLALESIHDYCTQPNVSNHVLNLFVLVRGVNDNEEKQETTVNTFVELVSALQKIVHKCLGPLMVQPSTEPANPQAIQTAKDLASSLSGGISSTSKQRASDYLGHQSVEAPPQVGAQSTCLELAVNCISSIVIAVGQLIGISPSTDVAPKVLAGRPVCDTEVMMRNVQVCRQMVETTWQHLLRGMQIVTLTVGDSAVLDGLLSAYSVFTQTCALVQLVQPRNQAIALLCQCALPGGAAEGGPVPLARKNIAITKALLRLAYELGGVLGEAWTSILEVMQRLDAALAERLVPGEHNEELIKLRDSLDHIFTQTHNLDDESTIMLLGSLCQVSMGSVSDQRVDIVGAAASGRSERMFGVEKMLQVMLHNLNRVGRLWEAATAQLSRVALHSRATVRKQGMSGLTQLIIATFKHRAAERKRAADPEAADEALDSPEPEQEFDIERRILAAYEELYRSQYDDTKNYVLDGLYQVLQSCGEEVGPAWPLVLALLKGVAQDREEQHVRVAFMCVQLIRNDFLSTLPVDCLQLLLTTIGSFGTSSDFNISLTAINLLWNIADFFERERKALLSAFSEVDFHPAPRRSDAEEGDECPERAPQIHNVDQLWLVLYRQLRILSVEERIEVRNSALGTLFTVLETHGRVLEKASWMQVVHELLLPVLDDVRESASNSGSDAPVEKALGPTGAAAPGAEGGQQYMLIHHTRNTPTKQWHVTWENAFRGVTRMFQLFFDIIRSLSGAEQAWAALMSHMESTVLQGSEKVAMAALTAVKELLIAHMGALPRNFWDSFWGAADRAITAATQSSQCDPKIVKHVIKVLGEIQALPAAQSSGLLVQENIATLVRMSDQLASAPLEQNTSAPTKLQNEALDELRSLTKTFSSQPKNEAGLWGDFFQTLVLHLPGSHNNYEWASSLPNTGARHPSKSMTPAVLSMIAEVFNNEVPKEVQALVIQNLVVNLLLCICSKHSDERPEIWRPGAEAFIAIAGTGVQALNDSKEVKGNEKLRIWMVMAAGLKSFLLTSDRDIDPRARESLDEAQQSEQIDISVANCLVSDLLPHAPSHEVEVALVSILDGAVAELSAMPAVPDTEKPHSYRFHLADACLENLFDLSSAPDPEDNEHPPERAVALAKLTAPIVLRTCNSIFEDYVRDEAEASTCPLPRARIEQVVSAARRLQALEVEPEVCQHTYEQLCQSGVMQNTARKSGQVAEKPYLGRSGRRGHLMLLYTPMCKCISSNNPMLRDSLRSMLEMVGWEVGLGGLSWGSNLGRDGRAPIGPNP